MKRFASPLLLGLLIFSIVGCAGGPKYSKAVETLPKLSAGEGRIYFFRNGIPVGVAVQPEIKLNDEVVGHSVPSQFFYVDRLAGNYIVSCSTEAAHKLSLALEAGETKYVRTEINMGLFVGQVKPLLEDEAQAMKTLKDCSYAGAK